MTPADRPEPRAKRGPAVGVEGKGDVDPRDKDQRRPRPKSELRGNEKLALPTNRAARIATRQQGPLTRQQLLDAGLGRNAIQRRARSGELHRMHRGVYLAGHRALAPLAREWAAVLACGAGAVLSHRSAARMWKLVDEPGDVEVTVGARRRRSREGIRVYRTARLDRIDVRHVERLPVTAPGRTLLDLAAIGYERLDRAFAEAHARRLILPSDLDAAIDRAASRRGVPAIRQLVRVEEAGITRSEAERRLRKLLVQARLPQPRTNARVNGFEVDFLWPSERLIVEVDSYAYHGHRAAFERDRRKDLALIASGYQVIRVTWRQLMDEPFVVVATLSRALATSIRGGRATD